MQFWDYLLTGTALAAALWYLYRRIVVTRGCSCGASSCANAPQKPQPSGSCDPGGCSGCAGNRDQQ